MTRYLSLEGASVLLKLPFWVQREVLQVQYYVAADHLSPGICAADCFHACVLSSPHKWVRRHYDLPLEWMDDRFGRNQKRNRDRVAQYFLLPFSDRIKAIKRDPRVSVTISSMGTDMGPGKTVTYKGTVTLHDDQATKDWFYPAMGELLDGYPATSVEAAIEMLDTPNRLILELVPEMTLAFDGDKVAEYSRQAAEQGT